MATPAIDQIQFYSGENRSADELGGPMPLMTNALVDSVGTVHSRPGVSEWSDFPSVAASGSPVIGMIAWQGNLVWVTADRRIHAWPVGGDLIELSSDTDPNTKLDGGLRPCFVDGRQMLVIAGGGAVQKWTGSGLSARLINTGAGGPPPSGLGLSGIAQRLVVAVADQSGQVWWSGPLEEYENWDMALGGSSYIQAAAKPDPILALSDNTNEVFCWGTQTIQVFSPANLAIDANDPNNVLDFAPSRTTTIGLGARCSIVQVDDNFAALDALRRILITDARTYTDISAPVVKLIRDFGRVDDCWGFRLRWGKWDALVFMFPSEQRGLVWNVTSSSWSEWLCSTDGGSPSDLTITSAYHWAEQDLFLVGMNDGTIAQIDENARTDLGNPIPIRLVSGFVTHGSLGKKACRTFMAMLRRNAISTGAKARLSFRDDLGPWRFLKEIAVTGSAAANLEIRSAGVYRQRQWMIEYSAASEFSLVSAQEEYEQLGA